jgi:transposase InsO family protein
MGILGVLTAPRSPWQNAYAEPFIGSLGFDVFQNIFLI